MFFFRRNRRGPKPDVLEGIYERDTDVSQFRRDGPPEAWWIQPDRLEGEPGLEPDDQGRVQAQVRLVGWVSGPGRYGHLGLYERELDVLRVDFVDRIRPARHRRIGYVTYTLEADDLETAAAMVGQALRTRLHIHHSPMLGRWYADIDPGAIAGRPQPGEQPIIRVMVTPNDPEPGVVPPRDAEGLPYVLTVLTLPGVEHQTHSLLRRVGIRFQPFGVGPAATDGPVRPAE